MKTSELESSNLYYYNNDKGVFFFTARPRKTTELV